MAISTKLQAELRSRFMEPVKQLFADKGEEILVTGSGEFAMPCIDLNGEEQFIVIKFVVPKGEQNGDPYDGYSVAEAYEMKQKEKADKAKEAEKKKAEKMKKDAETRAKKAEAKAKHLAEG